VICGDLVTATNGKSYPTYIKFKSSEYVAFDNQNTLWFSNTAFETEYPEYTITVVPPLAALDTFFSAYSSVVNQLNALSYTKRLEMIQKARADHPETVITSEDFLFYNPNNAAAYISTPWTFLINGPRGNDPDAIKQALITYLQANSTRELGAWKGIFPDIFKSTEFLIIPKWNQYSIKEMTMQQGIYSPIITLSSEIAYAKSVIKTDYTPEWINSSLMVMSHPYKSLMLLVIGGPDNKTTKRTISDIFPDLISVSSTSNDFSRMTTYTMEFLDKLAEMMVIAESMTNSTSIPNTYKTSVRDGVTYLTLNYDGVNFYVASKKTTP
jgi:hypothetical protein